MLASISRRVAGSVRTAASKSQPIRSIHSINGLSHVTSTPTSTPNLSRALPRSSLSAVAAAAAKSSAKASPSSKSSSKKLTPANDPNFKLSPEQVAFYHENGYLVIENFAPDELTTAMRLRAAEIIEDFAKTFSGKSSVFSTTDQVKTSDDYFLTSGDKIRCFFEEGAFDKDGNLKHDVRVSINKIGHALQELDPVFRRFSNSPQLLSIAKSFGYTDPIILQGMYIFKQPMFGGVVSPHQDSTFLYTDPPSTMGYWLAVEDATPENGCLWAVPGSHKIGCLQRFVRSPDGKGTTFEPKTAAKLPTEPAVCLPAKKGTVVLLHGSLVHFSYENKSPISRHAYTVHMIEGHNAQYPADNWLQRFDGKPFMRLTGTC